MLVLVRLRAGISPLARDRRPGSSYIRPHRWHGVRQLCRWPRRPNSRARNHGNRTLSDAASAHAAPASRLSVASQTEISIWQSLVNKSSVHNAVERVVADQSLTALVRHVVNWRRLEQFLDRNAGRSSKPLILGVPSFLGPPLQRRLCSLCRCTLFRVSRLLRVTESDASAGE